MQNLKENWLVLSKMTKNWSNFCSQAEKWLHFKNKLMELNQNQNLKQPVWPDAMWKLNLSLEINEQHN